MKLSTKLACIAITTSVMTSCGKSLSKKDSAPAPDQPSAQEQPSEPIKELEKRPYPFTVTSGEASCEYFKSRLNGKNWKFDVTFKNFRGLDQTEEVEFQIDQPACYRDGDKFILIAEGLGKHSFNTFFYGNFTSNAGSMIVDITECGPATAIKMIDNLPEGEKPNRNVETPRLFRTVTENFCPQAIDKMTNLILQEISN